MDNERKLSEEDMQRVQQYLNSPIHQVDRKPFRPLYFVMLSFFSVVGLLLLALLVTYLTDIT